MQLTREQRVFIVTSYNRSKSLKQVQNSFVQQFPERTSPTKRTILKNVQKFNENGTILNLNKGHSGRQITVTTERNIQLVRQVLEENPSASVRRNDTELSRSSFHRIVRKELKFYPYKMEIKHQLLDADLPRRVRFAEWFLERPERFAELLVVGDEAGFCMNGMVNRQNCRHYSPKNHPPENNIYEKSMNREKLSLWAGLCGNGAFIGPIFFDGNLNGEGYLEMIER
jgi:hypothetical protein